METPHSSTLETEASHENTAPQRLEELATISPELARRVAQNPSVPPELLRELSRNEDVTTRATVTANPNTPTDILLELAAEFPEIFLDNPIASLLYLEQLNFVTTLNAYTALRLLQCEKAPPAWLELADIEVRLALAGSYSSNIVRARTASKPPWVDTPIAVLEQLANDDCASVRQKIAGDPRTPVDILERLAGDRDEKVRACVATTQRTPIAVLERLANDDCASVRHKIADHQRTPLRLLEQLASDSHDEVRQAVASNEQTPLWLLEQLASDSHDKVRQAVVSNGRTPLRLLEQLASDSHDEVRQAVASNERTPFWPLERLANDPSSYICEIINRRRTGRTGRYGDWSMGYIFPVPKSPNPAIELLQERTVRLAEAIHRLAEDDTPLASLAQRALSLPAEIETYTYKLRDSLDKVQESLGMIVLRVIFGLVRLAKKLRIPLPCLRKS